MKIFRLPDSSPCRLLLLPLSSLACPHLHFDRVQCFAVRCCRVMIESEGHTHRLKTKRLFNSRIDGIRQTKNETRLDRTKGTFDGTGHGNLHPTTSTTAAYRWLSTLHDPQASRYSTPSLGIYQRMRAGVRSVTYSHFPSWARLPYSLSVNNAPMHLARTHLLVSMGQPASVPPRPFARTAYSLFYTRLAFQAEHLSISSTVGFVSSARCFPNRRLLFTEPRYRTVQLPHLLSVTAIPEHVTKNYTTSSDCTQALNVHTPVLGTLQTVRLCHLRCAVMSSRPLTDVCKRPSSTVPTARYCPGLMRCT